MNLVRYRPEQIVAWNDFIKASKNGTFLFDRGYLDYHADRFRDHSLLVFDTRDRLRAVLPAHETDGNLVSHGGLTYGGLITDISMTTPMMLEVFDQLVAYCRVEEFSKVRYKTVPRIYARLPADEDQYALYRHKAELVRRDVLSVLEPAERIPYQERRKRKIKDARKAGLRA